MTTKRGIILSRSLEDLPFIYLFLETAVAVLASSNEAQTHDISGNNDDANFPVNRTRLYVERKGKQALCVNHARNEVQYQKKLDLIFFFRGQERRGGEEEGARCWRGVKSGNHFLLTILYPSRPHHRVLHVAVELFSGPATQKRRDSDAKAHKASGMGKQGLFSTYALERLLDRLDIHVAW